MQCTVYYAESIAVSVQGRPINISSRVRRGAPLGLAWAVRVARPQKFTAAAETLFALQCLYRQSLESRFKPYAVFVQVLRGLLRAHDRLRPITHVTNFA